MVTCQERGTRSRLQSVLLETSLLGPLRPFPCPLVPHVQLMELSLQRWGTSSDQDGQGLRMGKFWAAPHPTAALPSSPSPAQGQVARGQPCGCPLGA